MRRLIIALVAIAAIATSLWRIESPMAPLVIVEGRTGEMPWTLFTTEAARAKRAPIVIVAHGFAGSQQFMHPFAVTLAHAGYNAVTFDFPGHGRNPEPLGGGLTRLGESTRVLVDATREMIAFAKTMPEGDGRLALVGHSMASDIVVRAGANEPAVKAVVAVSAFAPEVAADTPANLMVVDGALEPKALHDEGKRIVGLVAPGQEIQPGVTYGRIEDGTARRLVLAEGVEHISVLYSREALGETRTWLDQAFAPRPVVADGFVDARGPWIGLLLLGIVAFAWVLVPILPRLATPPLGAGLAWRPLLAVSGIAAIATPLILWKVRTDVLPLALADYVFMHFALYGAIMWEGLRIVRKRQRAAGITPIQSAHHANRTFVLLSMLAVTLYATVAMGLPIDRYVANLSPTPDRAFLILVLFAATLPWFLLDEWITRGVNAPRFAYLVTKAIYLMSLALAIALDLRRLFFLVIIVPVILFLFTLYGLISGWVYRRTGHPALAAVANALAFAWFIALAFPLVGR